MLEKETPHTHSPFFSSSTPPSPAPTLSLPSLPLPFSPFPTSLPRLHPSSVRAICLEALPSQNTLLLGIMGQVISG